MTVEHRWSFPGDMIKTYYLLYNTLDADLRVQMSQDIWRLVYDYAPVRNRAVNWASGVGVGYTAVHSLPADLDEADAYAERLQELKRNELQLEPSMLCAMIVRQEEACEALEKKILDWRNMWFAPPQRRVDPHTKMSFEVQEDSFYCAVHALNNVARAVVLSPPDILGAIECTRTLEERFASPEDVMLAALREGIFMLQLKLTDVDDLTPLSSVPHLTGDHFMNLLVAAGGMLVYQPNGYGTGHYVALVHAYSSWLIVSMGDVLVRASTAANALNLYIAQTAGLQAASCSEARAARVAAGANRTTEEIPFIGLLPISLADLWCGRPETGTSIIVRTLLRRTLSELRLCSVQNADGMYDLWTPAPLSPCAIAELGWLIGFADSEQPTARCDGYEDTVAASFISSRHSAHRELNRLADEMLRTLNVNAIDDFFQLLIQTRSYLRSAPAIDLLFSGSCSSPFESELLLSNTFSFALMSNRRWFRMICLTLACNALIDDMEQNEKSLRRDVFPIAVLLALLCYCNMRAYGVDTPHNVDITLAAFNNRADRIECLPCAALPTTIRDMVMGASNELPELTRFACYDMSLWLLYSIQSMPGCALPPALVRAFAWSHTTVDDNWSTTDESAALVRLLRQTLFRLPLAGADFEKVQRLLHEQWCFETQALAEHNAVSTELFLAGAAPAGVLLSRDELLQLVDILAFDRRHLEGGALGLVIAADSDDTKPRYVARAAREGFVHMHRRTFGALTLVDDMRAPAVKNTDRVAMPKESGRWRTAQVRVSRQQQLSVVPLSRLAEHRPPTPNLSTIDASSWSSLDYKRRRTTPNLSWCN